MEGYRTSEDARTDSTWSERTLADLKDYAWCRADSARLALIDNLARAFNTLFAVAVLIVLAGIATVFLAMALTWALALWIGSLLYALLIIGGVFLLAAWAVYLRRDRLIVDRAVRMLGRMAHDATKVKYSTEGKRDGED